MRKISLILCAAFAVVLLSCNQTKTAETPSSSEKVEPQAGSIVYFQLDSVVKHYDMYNDLSSELDVKAEKIDKDLQARQRKFQNDAKDFQNQIDKGLLTRSEAEEKQQVLVNRQNDLQNYIAEKQQEMAEEQAVMTNKVLDAITTYLKNFNEEKKYSAIIYNAVIVGDPNLDITEQVIEGLNNEYTKNKKKGTEKETAEKKAE